MSTEGSDLQQTAPLRDTTVVLTRPSHQAAASAAALTAAGAEVLRLPTLAIEALPSGTAEPAWAALPGCRLIVFVSANAVRHGVPAVAAHGGIPPQARVAAVGRATAAALGEAGIEVQICPERGFDSEALLASDALQRVAGATVLIVRGQGGRELLAETLRARGAEVHYAEVYRRVCAPFEATQLEACWQSARPALIVATSVDGLQCLLDGAGPQRRRVLATPLAVIGERMLKQARNLGFHSDVVVTEPGEQALVAALGAWRARSNRPRTDQE